MSHFPHPETDRGTILKWNKRYYGEFECVKCSRQWESANSWLGFGQNCSRCRKLVYPYQLSYLKKSEEPSKGEHPQEKCERCKRLGYYCRSSDGVKVEQNRGGRYGNQERTRPSKNSGRRTRRT